MIRYFAMKSIGISFEADLLGKLCSKNATYFGTPKTSVSGIVSYGKTKNFIK